MGRGLHVETRTRSTGLTVVSHIVECAILLKRGLMSGECQPGRRLVKIFTAISTVSQHAFISGAQRDPARDSVGDPRDLSEELPMSDHAAMQAKKQ